MISAVDEQLGTPNPEPETPRPARQAYFFDSAARQNALKAELLGWRDTRFKRGAGRAAKKGICADCVSFVEAVLVAVKAIQPIAWPKYVVSSAGPQMKALILAQLALIPELDQIPITPAAKFPPLRTGDVMLCLSERGMPHLAIYAGDNNLWHCTERMGVAPVNVHPALKFVLALYRVKYDKPSLAGIDGECVSCAEAARRAAEYAQPLKSEP